MNTTKFHSPQLSRVRPANSHFVLALFWITILFQLTVLKHIWAIEGLSRFFNSAALLMAIIYATHSMISLRLNKNIWFFYISPGVLIFLGMFLNFTLNSIVNLNVINYFGLLLPWAIYLAMPALLKRKVCDSETLWHYFYCFILVAVLLGILEYFFVFNGALSTRVISTPNGTFLVGRFTIFHLLENADPYYRFYACFGEPGSLAMLLLPVIAYAYFHKKYLSLAVFIFALYLSDSLGGIIGIGMMIPLLIFLSLNKRKRPILIPAVIFILISSVIVISYMDAITLAYEKKQNSATVRNDNFINTMSNLPSMLVNNPIGFELAEGTSSASKNPDYYGSTFALGNVLQMGGISAFLGYLIVILVSLIAAFLNIIRNNISLEEKVVFTSLIVLFPFILQRTVIWDSAIFSFLFAPSIIRFLCHSNRFRYRDMQKGKKCQKIYC